MAAAVPARAQTCAQGSAPRPPLCRNGYNIDLYQGPVLAPLRVTAMGGAYAALAEGVDALGQNTAAAAVRTPYSANLLDYDVTLGAYVPGAFGQTDFDNRGEAGLNAFTFFYTFGALVQWGPFGFGFLADFQRYSLAPREGSGLPVSSIEIGRIHVSGGYTLLGDQLSIGGGLRGVQATVNTLAAGNTEQDIFPTKADNLLTMFGVSPELGALIKPDYAPFRIGATYRMPVTASGQPAATVIRDASGVRRAAGLALPERVHWPWELEVGVALSAGPRPLNPRWIDPHQHEARAEQDVEQQRRVRHNARELELGNIAEPHAREHRAEELDGYERYIRADEERALDRLKRQLSEERRARYQNWPRARILIVAEVLVTGSTDDGVGLQSFLRQEDVQSGERTSFQPRLGIEGEPVPDRLAARVGTYLEPSRYVLPPGPGVLSGSRQHFTFGLEMRAFTWNIFGIARSTNFTVSLAGDLAPRYQNLGVSIGTWH
jgi:hypothetical protein